MASQPSRERPSLRNSSLLQCLCWRSSDSEEPRPLKFTFPENPTLEDLARFLEHVTQLCEQLRRDRSSTMIDQLASQWTECKDCATSVMEGLPKEAIQLGRDQLLPLLSQALGGASHLHWAFAGLSLISWTLEMIDTKAKNSDKCLKLLVRTIQVMKSTQQIWETTVVDHVRDYLRDAILITFQCAIICQSIIKKPALWRCLNASAIYDSLASLEHDLDTALQQNIEARVMELQISRPSTLQQQLPYDRRDSIVGREETEKKVMDILERDSDEVQAVCLHGMGGIGKTTIGKNVLSSFQSQNTYKCCYVELPLKTKPKHLPECQKEILDKIRGQSSPEFSRCEDGKKLLRAELEGYGQPIFLFLDNVTESPHLQDLLPEAASFPKHSRILVTTRQEEVLEGMKRHLKIGNSELVVVKGLKEQAAKELLWKQLEQREGESLNPELRELERQVLKLCGGLPLALIVVGGYIADSNGERNAKVWRHVIKEMEKAESLSGAKDDLLYARIKFSIDELAEGHKRAFLDLVAFAAGTTQTKEVVECMVDPIYLDTLRKRALITLDEYTEGYVHVHDVLKALGSEMVRQDEKEIRIATQKALDKIRESPRSLEKVVGLMDVRVKAELLQHMPRLRFLLRVQIDGECRAAKPTDLLVVSGGKGGTFMPFDIEACKDLKVLEWEGGDASDLEVTSKTLFLYLPFSSEISSDLEVTSKTLFLYLPFSSEISYDKA